MKKGQAAMEYLMTYVWAIIATITIIGILSYFGIFNPTQYSPSAAIVTPPFYANAWNVNKLNSQVNLELKNNGGEDYIIDTVSLSVEQGASNCNPSNPGVTIEPSETIVVSVKCNNMAVIGNLFKAGITILYRKENSNLDIISSGTIVSQIR